MEIKYYLSKIKEYGLKESFSKVYRRYVIHLRKYVMEGKISGSFAFYILVKSAGLDPSKKRKSKEKLEKLYQRIIKKYDKVELYYLYGMQRIGEGVPRYLQVCRRNESENNNSRILRLFIPHYYKGANTFLLKIMGRSLNLVSPENYESWHYVIKRLGNIEIVQTMNTYEQRKADDKIIISPDEAKKWMKVTKSEEKEFERKKSVLGIKDKYVCISSRDSAFLKEMYSFADFSYHDYRDSSIENLSAACEYLKSKGIQTVRMGALVKERASFDNCIDFASDHYDGFMDVMLHRHCMFDILDSSGINVLPLSQDVPVAYKNVVPAFYNHGDWTPKSSDNICIFKKYWVKEKNRFMSIVEMMEFEERMRDKLFNAKTYEQCGIDVIENSTEEIRLLTEEMFERLNGEWIEDERIAMFKEKYRLKLQEFTKKIGVSMGFILNDEISSSFIKMNDFLMEGI